MKARELKQLVDETAPFSISQKLIEKGYYDNSGIICEGEDSENLLCALDLTYGAVEYAKQKNCKLILTHHPAIFSPIKKIDGVVLECVKNGIGVVSAHLNLDFCEQGIDYHLAKVLGATEPKILENYDFGGYGRLFDVEAQTLGEFATVVKQKLNCKNICIFGKENVIVKKVATFCGAGIDEKTLSLCEEADLIISADVKHHLLLALTEKGKCVIMPTHFATENYGFKQFCLNLSKKVKETVFYFEQDTLL